MIGSLIVLDDRPLSMTPNPGNITDYNPQTNVLLPGNPALIIAVVHVEDDQFDRDEALVLTSDCRLGWVIMENFTVLSGVPR